MKIVKQSASVFVHYPFDLEQDVFLKPATFVETAGRTAYQSADKIADGTAQKFVKFIKAQGHTSVLEHCSASARLVTDRGVMAQLTRHRVGIAFTVESTRYNSYNKAKFGNEITVIEPPGLPGYARLCWEQACLVAECKYMTMLRLGITPEIARSVLPTCLKTEIVVTANFRSWLHILSLRTASDAHPQTRELLCLVQNKLAELVPEIFENKEVIRVAEAK